MKARYCLVNYWAIGLLGYWAIGLLNNPLPFVSLDP